MDGSKWYMPGTSMMEEYETAVDLNVNSDEPLDPKSWKSSRKAWLKLTIIQADDLPAMDHATGKADPYCVIKFGSNEQFTSVQQKTTSPTWNHTCVFEVDNIPQTAFSFSSCTTGMNGAMQLPQVPLCELLYYIYIDVWDRDSLNRDDYIGRVILPVANIENGTCRRWYPIGRTPSSPAATGRIEISLTLKSLDDGEPLPRWCIDDVMQKDSALFSDFQLPIMSEGVIINYPGVHEQCEFVVDDVLVEVSGHHGLGRVYLTDFRIIIICTRVSSTNLVKMSDLSMWVALNLILSVERGDEQKVIRKTSDGNAGVTGVKTLILKCEDFRTIRLTFLSSKTKVHTFLETKQNSFDDILGNDIIEGDVSIIDRLGSVASKSDINFNKEKRKKKQDSSLDPPMPTPTHYGRGCRSRMFHIFHKRLKFILWNSNKMPPTKSFVRKQSDKALSGWNVYDIEKEFERQGVTNNWVSSKLNFDNQMSDSYPCVLYLPSEVSESDIIGSASFRSKGRIPALTWFDKNRGTFIMRCSQPKIGTTGKHSVEDENLVQRALNISPMKRLVIFDARSMLAASGNRLKGKGTEDIVNRYRGMKLLYMNIANIHAMRESIDKLQTVCESVQDNKWLSLLESTQWLSHIRSVLKGATLVAHYLTEKNTSVLVHCSDGWDRTPQLTSLAQILLDPFYRTFKGFKILVIKDWISFGHRFKDRLGDPMAPSQRSPIFLQFLDCVCQILFQFPSSFEFTSGYLLRIAQHINSGWFGNFLCNSFKEREQHHMMRKTISIWAHLDTDEVLNSFHNPIYKETNDTLFPVSSLRRLQFWNQYYLRFDDVAFLSGAEGVEDLDEVNGNDDFFKQANTVVWVPDERVQDCHDCKQKFTGIRRRHHCRACGQVFCGGCTSHRACLPFLGYNTPERVCDVCWTQLSKATEDQNADDYEIITNDLSSL